VRLLIRVYIYKFKHNFHWLPVAYSLLRLELLISVLLEAWLMATFLFVEALRLADSILKEFCPVSQESK